MIISPSLLACDFLNIESELKKMDSIDNIWIHLDIMDGHFVPNLTFGNPIIEKLQAATRHKLDAHLMVTNPLDYVETFKSYGVYNFTFHWESVIHHDRTIKHLKDHFPSVGVSLNPSTNISTIPHYLLKELDVVLIMSVNPGFGGQSFIPSTMKKVRDLFELSQNINKDLIIQVDGGVNKDNAQELARNGANNLVAGSYIFKQSDYTKAIESLR